MNKKGLHTWGFKKFSTENKNIFDYEGIEYSENKMRSYKIFPGLSVLLIDFVHKYTASNSDYDGSDGYRVAYCSEGNYFTYIHNKKVMITRELFIGKSVPQSQESYCTGERNLAFNIVISPREIDESADYSKITKGFLKNMGTVKDIGYTVNTGETIRVADQLIECLRKRDLTLISLKTLELLYLISEVSIAHNRKKYYKDDVREEILLVESYLRNNLDKHINLDLLCNKFGISKTNLNAGFIRRFQYTPIKYLNNLRMLKAEELLTSTCKQIIEISIEVGFKNPSNFTRSFKKFTGTSPGKYRIKNKNY